MNDDDESILFDTDSYKVTHPGQYPPEARGMASYFMARGGLYPYTVLFGTQYMTRRLARRITTQEVLDARDFYQEHIPGFTFPTAQWLAIVNVCGGKLPIRIRALPEGSIVPTGNVLLTVESTGPASTYWVVGWVETMLMRLWYTSTVATQARVLREQLGRLLAESSDDPAAELDHKLHDFGSRGVSSRESAALGAAAHLVSFNGTDTPPGLRLVQRYYAERMAGTSVVAGEHGTVSAWGPDRERDYYAHMIDTFAPQAPVIAFPTDTYNVEVALRQHLPALHEKIRTCGSTIVARLDSGDPVPVMVNRALGWLREGFGMTPNRKGFLVLPPYLRILQGDGMGPITIPEVAKAMHAQKYSLTNMSAFGMGGAGLQQVSRSMQEAAYKACELETPSGRVAIGKRPVDAPWKASLWGYHDVVRRDGKYETVLGRQWDSQLSTVFEDGECKGPPVWFGLVRERARGPLPV